MSGIDEQTTYPPDCPKCGDCREWFVRQTMWIVPKRAAKSRGLEYSLICHSNNGPTSDIEKLNNRFLCVSCKHEVEKNSVLGKKIARIIVKLRGTTYYTNCMTKRTSNRWNLS